MAKQRQVEGGLFDDRDGAGLTRPATNILAISRASVTNTSKTLAGLDITVDADLRVLSLYHTGTIYWALGGAASALTALLPSDGISFAIDATTAATLQFYAAGATVMSVYQEGAE